MTAPTTITAAPFVLDDDEMAELMAEDARAELIEQARDAADERARWNRDYSDGNINLDEWLEMTGRDLADFMPRTPFAMPGVAGL